MIWKEENPAESRSYCLITLANHKKISCCDGAVPIWVLLVTYQLARNGGDGMSSCLSLTSKCLRSSEGDGARKRQKGVEDLSLLLHFSFDWRISLWAAAVASLSRKKWLLGLVLEVALIAGSTMSWAHLHPKLSLWPTRHSCSFTVSSPTAGEKTTTGGGLGGCPH